MGKVREEVRVDVRVGRKGKWEVVREEVRVKVRDLIYCASQRLVKIMQMPTIQKVPCGGIIRP